jgi:hypothetical protein
MHDRFLFRGVVLLAVLALGLWQTAVAQISDLQAPTYRATDINDVDLLSGTPYVRLTDLKLGSETHPLVHTTYVTGPPGT